MKSRKLRQVLISDLKESGKNELIYRPVNSDDPQIISLANAIRKNNWVSPLIISKDMYIISGHRRKLACLLLGKKSVPCEVLPITSNNPKFLKLLREFNRQRDKGYEEIIREGLIDATEGQEDTDFNLGLERLERSYITVDCMEIDGTKARASIKGNRPLLDAAIKIIYRLEDFWPLSDRAVHYQLLNDPPLKHRSKPTSIYKNNRDSYQVLTNILTRGRLFGEIPWESIGDETRPVIVWNVHSHMAPFIKGQLDGFMKNYFRNYMQSQPNHIEIVGEKLTIESIVRPVAMKYCIPYTIGKGYSSINPRHEMAERFKKSGKEKLIILLLSDFDPDGVEISQSFARSMRDDFDVDIHPIKVALRHDQVVDLKLPKGQKAKGKSKNYKKFVEKYGKYVFELEAVTPQKLQEILTDAIKSIVDADSFNHEMEEEQKEKLHLREYREKALKALGPQT